MMASPGPGKGRGIRGPSGPQGPSPATPQQSQATAYNDRGSPRMGRQSPHLPPQGAIPDVGNQLADLDADLLRNDQKRSGHEWYAVFNPRLRRAVDIDLLHTFMHESVVCCVRFSLDGKYIATGCNRSAQIFDVQTGHRVQTLEDNAVDKEGDLYIRSVCFSPDGNYLATGAEDKQIRVGTFLLSEGQSSLRVSSRFGTSTPIRFCTPSEVTIKTFIPSTTPGMAHSSPPAAAIARFVSGISRVGLRRSIYQSRTALRRWRFRLMGTSLRPVRLIRAFASGIHVPVDFWRGWTVLWRDIRIASTPWLLLRTEDPLSAEVWIRQSKCGDWVKIEGMVLHERASASVLSKGTR